MKASVSVTRASGGKVAWSAASLGLKLTFTAKGRKSSEGDGRTAADIRRELERTN